MPDQEPYLNVLLTDKEALMIGKSRYNSEDRFMAILGRAVIIFTVAFAIFVMVTRIQWLILGLLLPIFALLVLGMKQANAISKAGREFLDDVKASNADED